MCLYLQPACTSNAAGIPTKWGCEHDFADVASKPPTLPVTNQTLDMKSAVPPSRCKMAVWAARKLGEISSALHRWPQGNPVSIRFF
jgi:hypothetical protein